MPAAGHVPARVAQPQHYEDYEEDEEDFEGGGGGGGPSAGVTDLPMGVDAHELEEARMLEAALLGVPYQGRIPDFSNRPARAASSVQVPGLSETRDLRWEQDRDYEESLAADRWVKESR